eukprot:7643446-Pyramimonas_sp.AAC.1
MKTHSYTTRPTCLAFCSGSHRPCRNSRFALRSSLAKITASTAELPVVAARTYDTLGSRLGTREARLEADRAAALCLRGGESGGGQFTSGGGQFTRLRQRARTGPDPMSVGKPY